MTVKLTVGLLRGFGREVVAAQVPQAGVGGGGGDRAEGEGQSHVLGCLDEAVATDGDSARRASWLIRPVIGAGMISTR